MNVSLKLVLVLGVSLKNFKLWFLRTVSRKTGIKLGPHRRTSLHNSIKADDE